MLIENDDDDDVVSKAATSLKDMSITGINDNETTEQEQEQKPNKTAAAPQPSRLLTRHGSVSGLLDSSSQDVLNSRAIEVINRIQSKLNGRDFYSYVANNNNNASSSNNTDTNGTDSAEGSPAAVVQASTVEEQVDRLIIEATSVENLCQLFVGWCPFW